LFLKVNFHPAAPPSPEREEAACRCVFLSRSLPSFDARAHNLGKLIFRSIRETFDDDEAMRRIVAELGKHDGITAVGLMRAPKCDVAIA